MSQTDLAQTQKWVKFDRYTLHVMAHLSNFVLPRRNKREKYGHLTGQHSANQPKSIGWDTIVNLPSLCFKDLSVM